MTIRMSPLMGFLESGDTRKKASSVFPVSEVSIHNLRAEKSEAGSGRSM